MVKTNHPPGTILTTPIGIYTHYGIATGVGSVIAASKKFGRVTETSYEDFCDGQPITERQMKGTLAGETVVQRARSRIGATWNPIFSNCESFVKWAHNLPAISTQVVATGVCLFFLRKLFG